MSPISATNLKKDLFKYLDRTIEDNEILNVSTLRRFVYGNYKIIYEAKEPQQTVYVKHVKNCTQDESSYIK
jgi:mRNA-degrading endonuclease RelE of RelBE toxin-antitoxin system